MVWQSGAMASSENQRRWPMSLWLEFRLLHSGFCQHSEDAWFIELFFLLGSTGSLSTIDARNGPLPGVLYCIFNLY